MKINFSRIFQGLADRYGENEALVNIERNRRYTFGELHLLTNRIANMMREKLELGRGDKFLSILDNDNIGLLHLWTSYKGDSVAAWTNYRDSLDEHTWQPELIKPKAVFIENALLDSHLDMLRDHGVAIVCMDPLENPEEGVAYLWDLLEGVGDHNPDVENDLREDTVLLRFTGGTTGKGKCAEYSMDNWLSINDGFSLMDGSLFTDAARFLHLAPLSHGTALLLLPTFLNGGCTITMNAPDLATWCRYVQQERATMGMMVPTIMYRLLEMPEASEYDLSSLETLFYGAAPISPTKLKLLQSRFGNIFFQVYGATENPSIACYMDQKAHAVETKEDEERLSACGRPSIGTEVLIADEEGKPVNQGEIGEIWIRSRGTIRGYYGNPELTSEEFVNGFWKSGDMAYKDPQGFVHIVDRKKDMIITGGFNVYATEVEAAISSHKAVVMSVVVGVPHEEWGEAVQAEVILKDGMSCTEEDIIQHVKAQIGRFKAPKKVIFVKEFPVSAVGKVLRKDIRKKYWAEQERQVG